MAELSRFAGDDAPGSWSFSVRSSCGRVIACVPNRVLRNCFGARTEDELFKTFTAQIEILNKAVLARLEEGYCPVLEIEERDIFHALGGIH